MSVSPLWLEVAFHYACCAGEFERITAPAVRECVSAMVERKLLEFDGVADKYGATYHATDGLRAWVAELCRVPLPVQVWAIDGRIVEPAP